MLVTDGAVDTYDAIFAKFNWPDRKVVYYNMHTTLVIVSIVLKGNFILRSPTADYEYILHFKKFWLS